MLRYRLIKPGEEFEDLPGNYFVMTPRIIPEKVLQNRKSFQEDNMPNAVPDMPQGEKNPMLQALKNLAEKKSDK